MTYHSESPEETIAFGCALGRLLRPGDVVALVGELAAGKTVLTKGIARGLEVPESCLVSSPTFVIIHEYTGRLRMYHCDAYRLSGPDDIAALGSDEIFFGDGVTVVEWADRVQEVLPDERLTIEMSIVGKQQRRIRLLPGGGRYINLVGELRIPQFGRSENNSPEK